MYSNKKNAIDELTSILSVIQQGLGGVTFTSLEDNTSFEVKCPAGHTKGYIEAKSFCEVKGNMVLRWMPSQCSKIYAPKRSFEYNSIDEIPDGGNIAQWVFGIKTDLGL